MQKLKQQLARVFDDNLHTKQWHNWVDYTIIGLIVISTIEVFLSTFDSIVERYGTWLHAVDIFTTVFFTIEVSLRIWCADLLDPKYKGFWGRIRYCLSFYGLIDILSTYTFYIAFLLPIPYSLLKALRIARLMRMFRYMKAFRLLSEAINSKRRELWVSLQFLCIVTLILSFILYFVEHEAQPEVYDNGWTSVVWAFAQYIGDPGSFADQPPITLPGKIIACIVGLLGIAIFAVPAGLVGSGFSDVMDEKRHEENAAEWSEELHNAFEHKLDRTTGWQIVPPFITIPEAQARIWHKEDEILDAVNISKDMRLINLAVTRPLGEYSDDRLAVELFPLNTPYGCCIDRSSKITIVAPSNVVDPVIGHFAYHLALIGGFNYLSREKGQQKPYRSYYQFDDEQAIEGLSEYMADLRKLTAQKDAWAITLLAASGANESEHPEQLHFEYGGKKGEDSFASDLASSEDLQKLYNAISVSLKEQYGIKTSNQKYHDTSSPRNFYRKIGQPVNGLMLRIAWSVTCWDYRHIQIAATMADIIHHELDSNNMKYRPDNLKQKTIGYGID